MFHAQAIEDVTETKISVLRWTLYSGSLGTASGGCKCCPLFQFNEI